LLKAEAYLLLQVSESLNFSHTHHCEINTFIARLKI